MDAAAGLSSAVSRLEAMTGFKVTAQHRVIGEDETFLQWCERLARGGMKVDGKPFRLDDRPAMAWIYGLIPANREQAFRRTLVLMKCAQVGFTVMEIAACIYMGLKFGPATIGMFLPDINLAGVKSTERFMPIVRSVPEVHSLMTQDAADGSGRKSGEGNVTRRRVGEVLFVFSWTSGKTSTESIPMDVVSLDEIQGMTLAQIEKTHERMSASPIRFTLMGSTANWPDLDIHFWYKQGTRHQFYTRCPACGDEAPLDSYFPDCIQWDEDAPGEMTEAPGCYRYVCKAGHWIDDPQCGEWRAEDPDALITSIHFPQMLSPTITPGEIMEKFLTSTDKKNFYNRVLGKPWLDPTEIPVTMAHLNRCVEEGAKLGLRWKTTAKRTVMGLDQMGQFVCAIIKERLPDGRQAVVHIEEIYSDDPFMRCSELMHLFDVETCVVEINPNYNDAKRFAHRHKGRVFLCNGFGALPDDMVRWGDAPLIGASDRRTSDEARDRYTVKADQFKCMQTSMARLTANPPLCLFPPPQDLVQEVIEKGVKQLAAVTLRAFHHFTKTALRSEKDDETNKYVRKVVKVGIDPHMSYANQLCDVAWARSYGTGLIYIPDVKSEVESLREAAVGIGLPGLPPDVVRTMLEKGPDGTCGGCFAYPREANGDVPKSGVCAHRGFTTEARAAACPLHVSR
jgi:hypothetical protein